MIISNVGHRVGAFKQKVTQNPGKYLIISAATLIVLLPILSLLAMLIKYSVNVPWWDQLSFVDLMSKLHNGNLTLHDLWQQHNEHRILMPQVVELVTGKLTGFNFRVPVLLNFVMAV